MAPFCRPRLFQRLNRRHSFCDVDPVDASVVKEVNEEIAEGNHVIAATGHLKVNLIEAGKHDVPLENWHLPLLYVLTGFNVFESPGKTEINQV